MTETTPETTQPTKTGRNKIMGSSNRNNFTPAEQARADQLERQIHDASRAATVAAAKNRLAQANFAYPTEDAKAIAARNAQQTQQAFDSAHKELDSLQRRAARRSKNK